MPEWALSGTAGAALDAPSCPRPARSNLAVLAFVVASLAVSMSVGQEEEIDPGSLKYWLLIAPAAALPLADIGALMRTLWGRAKLLLAMLVVGGAWQLASGDARAALQLGLLVWVLCWVASGRCQLAVRHVAWIFGAFVGAGIGVDLLTDLNPWGLLPGRTADEYGVWRISFFPNIANTAMLSLFVLLLLTRSRSLAVRHLFVFALALYFLAFSFVRTALIAAVLYAALRWWFVQPGGPRGPRMAWIAGAVAIGANVMIASSAIALGLAQDFPVLSRLLLRGESGLSAEEIFQQLYRPWLWGQHLALFIESPLLMGHGSFDFAQVQTGELIEGHPGIGSDALPTRMLAAYGLAGSLFTVFLFVRLRALALAGDAWACAAFPSVVLLMMNWGSVFHPTNAFFALYLLIATRGSKGFDDGR